MRRRRGERERHAIRGGQQEQRRGVFDHLEGEGE